MSKHRIPRASLHEDLIDIERRQCEKVNVICPDPADPDYCFVYTNDDYIETRAS